MNNVKPKVSIGLAVFNGEKYLREAINSILTQTFRDFELIICDNASTDKTEAICREYATKDSRIRYYRNSTNIGGANNENLTFKLCQGKYFRLAAHDDVLASNLIAKCVEVLDQNPEIVLCYSNIVKIDENGQEIGILDQDKANASKPSKRFQDLANWNHDCETTYGLVRSDILSKTDLQLNYTDSDRTLLCELSLYGRFYKISEPLFYKRYHPDMSTQIYPDSLERMSWFNPSENEKIIDYLQLTWIQYRHYLEIVSRTPLLFRERISCYFHVNSWFLPIIVREEIARIRRQLFINRQTLRLGKQLLTKFIKS
jgi:glycosyltransferase involved in cell wall biosynthesis